MYDFRAVMRDDIIFIAHKANVKLPGCYDTDLSGNNGCSVVFYTDSSGAIAWGEVNLSAPKILKRFARGHVFLRLNSDKA